MSRYRFKAAERWGVFTAHGGLCYLCRKPVDLQTMEVDHVLPEFLLNDATRLKEVLQEYGLPADFDLNSYSNWMPSCGPCNRTKSGEPFRAAPIILIHLDRARAKADEAATLATEVQTDRKIARALNAVERAIDSDHVAGERFVPLIVKYFEKNPEDRDALLRSPPQSDDYIGFMVSPPEFRITPSYKVLFHAGSYKIVQTPRGIGYVPTASNPHSSFYCGHCGSLGPWNGARCVSCGMLDDGD